MEEGITPYAKAYFDRFQEQAHTPLGRSLMTARVKFVKSYYRGPLLDIGIGCGAFIELRNAEGYATFGYDVNPVAKEWLEEHRLTLDPYKNYFPAVSFWDVLEHIPDFKEVLRRALKWAFVSIPIFSDCEHVLRSKHYRKDEHVWYFTRGGLIQTFRECGFEPVEVTSFETALGREDIETFAFRRR